MLIYLQTKLWFGNYGLFELWSLQNDIEEAAQNNQELSQRNERLYAEVEELEAGEEALEERARSQLGFIKEGEVFYRVTPSVKDNKGDEN